MQSPSATGVADTFMQRMQALMDQFMPSFQDMIHPKEASAAPELTQEVAWDVQDMQKMPA